MRLINKVIVYTINFTGTIARVVCDTEIFIAESCSSSALTRLVLPVPEGAEIMYNVAEDTIGGRP
jgi:hypothetical protein